MKFTVLLLGAAVVGTTNALNLRPEIEEIKEGQAASLEEVAQYVDPNVDTTAADTEVEEINKSPAHTFKTVEQEETSASPPLSPSSPVSPTTFQKIYAASGGIEAWRGNSFFFAIF